ncbi:unnamed protein product [Lasius platythorax]|uniref:Secreted protein n=1 Tax=Lasius platythorax TaxID=488582 RepID=A0AAV2N3A8_9HYME
MQAETRTLMGNIGWLYLHPLPFLARCCSIVRGRPIYLPYSTLVGQRSAFGTARPKAFSILSGSGEPLVHKTTFFVAELGIDYSPARLNSTSFFVIREMTF